MPDWRALPLTIPGRGDPDRKRALNVLAQRRYRQRKRERLVTLEGSVRGVSASSQAQSQANISPTPETLPTPNETSESQDIYASGFHAGARGTESHTESSTNGPSSALPLNGWASGMNADVEHSLWLPDQSVFAEMVLTDFDTPLMPNDSDLGQELQSLESLQFTFPDDSELDVPALQVMKAGFTIAQMLDCEHSLWDPNASRMFDTGLMPAVTVPSNMESTEAQKRIAHHPLLDILPWPSVKTKLICVFAQPAERRPPAARDPLAVMQLVYDIDDEVEGFRVSGGISSDGANWEVGQAFFRNWWWALDRAIVERSNTLRAKRGVGRLRILPA